MAIHTEKPGGGDDAITVYRAKSADDARRARAALEAAGVPVDLPDQAIDAIYSTKPDAELMVRVALKHSAKAIKAIRDSVPKEAPATPIQDAEDKHKAADEQLAAAPAPAPPSDPDIIPVTAVDRNAKRAFIVSCASIMFPPVGIVGAFWGFSVLSEMNKRPNDTFRGRSQAKIATVLGLAAFVLGSPIVIMSVRGIMRRISGV